MADKVKLCATVLIFLALKSATTLPIPETNAIRETIDFEYYLDEFLRLYYNSRIVNSSTQKSSSVEVDDWWDMQGDQPSPSEDQQQVDPEQADRINAIAVEELVDTAKRKQLDAAAPSDASMEYLIKMRKRLNESGEIEERAKDNWIQLLKQNILKQVGWSNYSTIANGDVSQDYQQGFQQQNRTSILDLLRGNGPENGSKATGVKFDGLVTEKIRSYYPQCELPKGTDTDLWNDENVLNLYYNFDVSEGDIQTANLRLYRLLNDSSLNCDDGAPSEDDKILRVSAYWYLKPLKKQKAVKRRMCDSKVISEKANWIELNVKPAMTHWLRGRNAGIAIVVEDQDGGVLKADHYFKGATCQAGGVSTPKPIPSFILDALRQPYDQNSAKNNQNSAHGILGQDARAALATHATLRLPSLDIKTSEPQPANQLQPPKATDHSEEDCDSAEHQEVQLRHTRHHHRQQHHHHQRVDDPGDPRSRMVATQIIWTSQQLMELQRAHQLKLNQEKNLR